MINILSYIGMSLQSEVCLWTLLGLLRTIFDATLFKVNANLKQVWAMKMPPEISLPVQRALRTMISGVMLAQCFTVYVYLASYIVLLYPVFLEERPTLVLPWLLLAAIRNLLCELTSLALGLGTCVLLGPARPPCVRFVITKLASIMPAFYMWMLIFGYYHNLKMASAFKTFPMVLPTKDLDYGLELAVRRRRTKSLQAEDQLRKKLIASLYSEQASLSGKIITPKLSSTHEIKNSSPVASDEDITTPLDHLYPLSITSNRTMSDMGTDEDWFGSEVVVPRDTDRILEQFVLMLLRIAACLKNENTEPMTHSNSHSPLVSVKHDQVQRSTIPSEEKDTPPSVGNSKGRTASYLTDYPQIFGKKRDVLGSLNTAESNLPTIKRTSSSEAPKCTKGVSTETISLKLQNDSTAQESKYMLINSKEKINVQLAEAISNNIDTEQVPNNSKMSTTFNVKSDINRSKAQTESKEGEKDKDKIRRTSERILNLNKYKRKPSTSSHDNDDKSNKNTSKQIKK